MCVVEGWEGGGVSGGVNCMRCTPSADVSGVCNSRGREAHCANQSNDSLRLQFQTRAAGQTNLRHYWSTGITNLSVSLSPSLFFSVCNDAGADGEEERGRRGELGRAEQQVLWSVLMRADYYDYAADSDDDDDA